MASRQERREYAREINKATVARLTVPLTVPHWSRPRWYQRAITQWLARGLQPPTNRPREVARRQRQFSRRTVSVPPDQVTEVLDEKGHMLLSYQGVADSLRGWARRFGISDSTLRRRIEKHGTTAAFLMGKE